MSDKGLWVAIIWNIKHAVELIIKTTGLNIDQEYLGTHNLKILLEDLEAKMGGRWTAVTKNRLKKVVKKYYRSAIFTGRKIVSVEDMKNDIFRYTNNHAKTNIDFSVFDKITRRDITVIEKDLKFLEDLFFTAEHDL